MYARGEVVEVDESQADFLLSQGAVLIDHDLEDEPAEVLGDKDDDALATKDDPAEPVEDVEPAEGVEDVEDVESVEVKKPRKTDKLAVWQAYATAIKHPWKGKTLDQLKTELG